MNSKKIHSIVIVGGGTAGWMCAARLSKHFIRTDISLTVLDSSRIGTVGVGEATIPTLRRFYQSLGLSDREVLSKTQATMKLGIRFEDWKQKGSQFIHAFGLYGHEAKGVPFYHYWLQARSQGESSSLDAYNLAVCMAEQGRFELPNPRPDSPLSIFDWALHFDAGLFGEVMRSVALGQGVTHIDAKIERVVRDNSTGDINQLVLDDGRKIGADLFIDCSGFSSLLLGEALQEPYEDWSEWLLCDRAVAAQSERQGALPVTTTARAHASGWQWRIPLQHRQGNGHVYASHFCSDDEAEHRLRQHIDGPLINEPKFFSFTPGRRRKAWVKNCIAVGLSSGFIEPLESTSIALVETAIEKICGSFPGPFYTEKSVARFNEVTALEYERIRDFIILHYQLNERDDSEFWRYCASMRVPDTLEEKIQGYLSEGHLPYWQWEIFHPDSWLAIFNGFGKFPKRFDARASQIPAETLSSSFRQMRENISVLVASLPEADAFLQRYLREEEGQMA